MGNNLQQNILADTLDAAGIMAQYDGWAVRIVSQKIILAWILKHCTEQYLPEAITKGSARCTASGYVLIQRRYVEGA